MFEFKKAMKNIMKDEGFECECCGPIEEGTSGCSSVCGPSSCSCSGQISSSCCEPMGSSENNNANGKPQGPATPSSDCSCS